jgi:hypothetical protein
MYVLTSEQFRALQSVLLDAEKVPSSPHDAEKELFAWRRAFPNFGWCADGAIRRVNFKSEQFDEEPHRE